MKLPLVLSILLAGLSVAAARADDGLVRVDSLEARLFLANTGAFSDPVNADSELWNVIIGNNPSHATLVKVLIAGPSGRLASKTFVTLAVTRGHRGRKPVVMKQRLGVFNGDGRQYVAFWLADTGCEEIEVRARIGDKGTVVSQRIPFECGE